MALQQVGESTCTLGEVRHRADVVVYWGSNPQRSHPRHWSRLVEPPGCFIPEGRKGRRVVVVDHRRTETTELADRFVQVNPGRDFELLWGLRAAIQGESLGSETIGGVPTGDVESFAKTLKEARYGVIFFGLGVTRHTSPHATVEALLRLVTDLNRYTRFTARRMRVPGDVAGADSVLCWQTGFPFSVNLARGYPRYNPDEYTADLVLRRGEVDAVVLVGGEGVEQLSLEAQRRLRRLPIIQLDPPAAPNAIADVAVRFHTAVYGVHCKGTAYRMDEVPIPLRPILTSDLPADHDVLREIQQQLP